MGSQKGYSCDMIDDFLRFADATRMISESSGDTGEEGVLPAGELGERNACKIDVPSVRGFSAIKLTFRNESRSAQANHPLFIYEHNHSTNASEYPLRQDTYKTLRLVPILFQSMTHDCVDFDIKKSL